MEFPNLPELPPWLEFLKDRTWQLRILSGALALVLLIVLMVAFRGSEAEPPEQLSEPSQPQTLPPPPENPYTPEDFRYEGDYLVCTAGETVMGIDVSAHQKAIDWQQAADAGVEFAMIRVGYRGYLYGELHADEWFAANVAGARAAGIRVGAYFFSQAVTVQEALEEAEFALELLEGVTLDLPLAYDWERMGDASRTARMDRRTLTDCTLAFCGKVGAAGYDPMVYFNSSQALDLLHLEELTEYPFWLAMYDITMAFPYRVDLWQYTNQGRVPGIATNVDVNLMFTEYGLGVS